MGNKKDLEDAREVTTDHGHTFAKEHKCYFLETSALDNSDKMIEQVFITLSEDLIDKRKDEDEIVLEKMPGKKIMPNAPVEEKKSGCC